MREQAVLGAVREQCQQTSTRQVAGLAGVHYPHLTEVLRGRRPLSRAMLAELEAVVNETDAPPSCSD